MIKATANYLASISPVFIDGVLFCSIAWFIFSQSYLGGDEAAKWIAPKTKFWLNFWIGSGGAVSGALKMFRSTAYGDHQRDKKENGTKPPFAV